MKKRAFTLLALSLALAAPVFAAEQTTTLLAGAEHAYQDVDFPATREQAQHALEAGGATPQQTARLHVLLGISAAALGDAADAKQHFIVALAVDPELRLDRGLSPKIRGPYLEAQGYWSASGERLDLRAAPSEDRAHVVVRLQDPASLVSRVEVRFNAVGSRETKLLQLAPAAESRATVPAQLGEHDYEYVVRALDGYGNLVSERGSDADPQLVRRSQGDTRAPSAASSRGRSYLFPAALAVTGLGAVAAGIVFNVKREQAAHEWNGPRCENPGFTRQQQCENVDSRIQSNERLAVGFYAGGGALIAGSVIALLAGRPPAPTERASTATSCSLLGPGVSCGGHF